MKKLNEILGTKYPIIQGGMANIATGEFAAACSNAGALGVIGAGGMRTADELRSHIRRCRELTDKPFGVNIMLMNPSADEFARVVIEERAPVVTTGAGNPGKYIPAWNEAGIKVIPVVAAVAFAQRFSRHGVTAVIAEGTESGGHVGEMTTMALVPQVIDSVNVPVIAVGGIADGRQMAVALALGACGVQVGTCLLTSSECPIHDNYKQALLKARDSDTIVTGRSVGGPVRVMHNRMSREYIRQEQQGATLQELEKLTLGGLRRAVLEGDVENGSVMCGQVAGMLHEVKPVAQILDEMTEGARRVMQETNGGGSVRFENRVAVLTGGSRGIGRAICLELAGQGASIVLCYAGNEQAAGETAEDCRALGARVTAVKCDVADAQQVKDMMRAAVNGEVACTAELIFAVQQE